MRRACCCSAAGCAPGREGRTLGIALAYAWAAFPYSAYVLQSNTNDGLMAMLLVYSLLALRTPGRRGALLGLATAAKFFPLALAPLFAAGTGDRRARCRSLRFAGAFAGRLRGRALPCLPDGGLRELWDTTLGYQLSRESPFSLWGLHPSLGVAPGDAPGRRGRLLRARSPSSRAGATCARSPRSAGAAVIALQLCSGYWLFFYVAWFAPLALVAMLGAYRPRLARSAPEP